MPILESCPLLLGAAILCIASTGCDRPAEPDAPSAPAGYAARRATATIENLLSLGHGAWAAATKIAWGPAPYATRFRALWSDDGLFIRFDVDDTSPWHTLTERDAALWNEEVVEIFIDPDADGLNYVELEINPINVVCDLQIFEVRPTLRSDIGWNFAGLESRVLPLRGSVAGPPGWTATAFLPWGGFGTLDRTNVSFPPRVGDDWRFNVFRIKRPGGPEDPERDAVYAAWSPPPGASFHAPEVFRRLEFVE